MRKMDLYWLSNDDWWTVDKKGRPHPKDDAPQEAKESYERYLTQRK